MKKKFNSITILCLGLLLVLSIFSQGSVAFGEESTRVVEYETTVSYDIWKSADGSWGSYGAPGSSVRFTESLDLAADSKLRLTNVEVSFVNAGCTHRLYGMSVRAASVKTISFNSHSVSFSVNGNLTANVAPADIRKISGASSVLSGYRYFYIIKIKLTYGGCGEEEDYTPSYPYDFSGFIPETEIQLPESAYQNHPVTVQDNTVFRQGDDCYPAYTFYRNGYGTNAFQKLSGPGSVSFTRVASGSAGYYSDRYAFFDTPGMYTVGLSATANGGITGTATGKIKILPVPDVSAVISGSREANSRLSLNAAAVLDPNAQLDSISIIISNSSGSEKLTITGGSDGNFTSSGNTETIKALSPEYTFSESYNKDIRLDFVTKNRSVQSFDYLVTVKDSEGRTAESGGSFTVNASSLSKPEIIADSQYVRAADSDTAQIRLIDTSDYSGKQVERSWFVWDGSKWAAFDYTDESEGQKKIIVHSKKGVGPVKYRLVVKEKIDELSSISDFVSEQELSESSAEVETEVINVAPTVEFTESFIPSATLLVLYDKSKASEALAQKSAAELALAESGIDAELIFQEISSGSAAKLDYSDCYHVLESPFSFKAQNYSYDAANYVSDSKAMYKVDATYGKYGGGKQTKEPTPASPYYVTACDINTGAQLWKISFTSTTFSMGNKFTLHQDSGEDYLYISNSTSTLVINKSNGSLVRTLSTVVGDCFTGKNSIYSFTSTGIQGLSKTGTAVSSVYSGTITGKQKLSGSTVYFAVNDGTAIRRGSLNLDTGAVSVDSSKSYGSSSDVCIGFDSAGSMLVYSKNSSTEVYTARLYSSSGELLKDAVSEGLSLSITPVSDGAGRYTHVIFNRGFSTSESGTTVHKNKYRICSLLTSDSYYELILESRTGAYKTSHQIMWAISSGDIVQFYTAAGHSYVWGSTKKSTSVSCRVTADMKARSFTATDGIPDFVTSQGSDFDNAYIGEKSICFQYTFGNPVNDGISGSSTVFFPLTVEEGGGSIDEYLTEYLENGNNHYNGIFIMSDNTYVYEDNEYYKYYSVDNGNSLKASVNSFINYVLSRRSSGGNLTLFYKKGEKVRLSSLYDDYEGDHSKESYYVYYHFPYNDGANPDVNYITDGSMQVISTQNAAALSSPITQFWQDGMYKVEHWQYDSTGNTDYDRKSNVASLIFFVTGDEKTSSSGSPEITGLYVNPSAPLEGQTVTITGKASDPDNDVLSGSVIVYSNNQVVAEKYYSGLAPSYPEVSMKLADSAAPGLYTAVFTASDGSSTVSESLIFAVTSSYSLSSGVNHTAQWDSNRKRYNLYLSGTEYNCFSSISDYRSRSAPRIRGSNVFWSEEKLVIRAALSGSPTKVTAEISGSSYSCTLADTGSRDENGLSIYSGGLWDSALKGRYGKNEPEEVNIIVKAYYSDGSITSDNLSIIYDDGDDYWRVHRLY